MTLSLDDADLDELVQRVVERIGDANRLDMVSVKGAAELLGGVSPKTVYSWIESREIPSYEFGRRTLLRVSELADFVESRRRA